MSTNAFPEAPWVLPPVGHGALPAARRKVALLVLRRLLTLGGGGLPPAEVRSLSGVQRALATLAKSSREPVLEALLAPDCVVHGLRILAGQGVVCDALRALVPALFVELSRRGAAGGLRETVLFEAPISVIPDVANGKRHRFDPPARGVTLTPQGVEVRLSDGSLRELEALEGDEVFVPISPGTGGAVGAHLALIDDSPVSHLEDHPDKSGNAVDLGDRTPAEWVDALRGALDVIERTLPSVHAELASMLLRVVPVGYLPERHESASYLEAPGTVYMTLHPDPMTLAEAIVHETQHGKLNLLMWLDPLLENGRSEWSKSPVRDDMRPLSGVLLAVHAFIPVATMHARLAEQADPLTENPRFPVRREEVIRGNGDGLRTLYQLGRFTPQGLRVREGLTAVHDASVLALEPLLSREPAEG